MSSPKPELSKTISIEDFGTHFGENSQPFSYVFPFDENNTFFLELYPKGGNPDYVSVYLKYCGQNENSIRIRIQLSIVNSNEQKCLTKGK